GRDAVAGDRQVPPVAGIARAVHDPATAEQHVVGPAARRRLPARARPEQAERGDGERHFPHVLLSESGRMIRPRTITHAMRRVAAMSAAGSASSTTRSATAPGAM